MKKIIGLNSLRFVLAFTVLLGHGALPKVSGDYLNHKIVNVLNGFLNNSTVGIAAVMAFFIISGFFIHYPYSSGKKIDVPEFYTRRIIRIAVPGIIAFLIYKFPFNHEMGVVWSLICEVIYYILYPLFLRNIRHLNKMIVISFIISYAISILYSLNYAEYNGDFHRTGFYITWAVGLPIWLLGVKLAERYQKNDFAPITFQQLNMYRLTVWFLSIICSIARFHLHISFAFSLPLFSIVAFFWLEKEIIYYQNKKENRFLDYGGLMSYSIYLIHSQIFFLIEYIFNVKILSNNFLLSMLAIVSSLFFSWIFYLLVEKPSHLFARSIKLNRLKFFSSNV
ncbi:acyltransferase [Flavobacterium sp.]|uniref:acyltransferase family protein n=1 Tax=Flavobacterium sp. TaxID=239 RepID=UPI002BE9B9B1|nr:acyltransferase [Flavobacterium sp.]HSD06042.1 acyltransferase [Flavobacterium sp.]